MKSKLTQLPPIDELDPDHVYYILSNGQVDVFITSNTGVPYPIAGSSFPEGYPSTPSLEGALGNILPDFNI